MPARLRLPIAAPRVRARVQVSSRYEKNEEGYLKPRGGGDAPEDVGSPAPAREERKDGGGDGDGGAQVFPDDQDVVTVRLSEFAASAASICIGFGAAVKWTVEKDESGSVEYSIVVKNEDGTILGESPGLARGEGAYA